MAPASVTKEKNLYYIILTNLFSPASLSLKSILVFENITRTERQGVQMKILTRTREWASGGTKTIRELFFICVVLIPSLHLDLLTLIALRIGVVQFFLLRPGQAPESRFLVLGSAGAAGLLGSWILIIIPADRLQSSSLLRIAVTAASIVGIPLAIVFLSGGSVYAWNLGASPGSLALYLFCAPQFPLLAKLRKLWIPRDVS